MKGGHIIIFLIAVAAAAIGGLITQSGMAWYATLHLPVWTPSGQIIGMVWTIIFLLSALSAIIIWGKRTKEHCQCAILSLFLFNAVLNVLWSFVFFNLHEIAFAVGEAALLGLTVYALIILIWRHSRTAALLLVPYAAWTTFATYLTYAVLILNR